MTYSEIIARAAFAAHGVRGDIPLDLLSAEAETVFPSVVEELAQSVAADLQHPWRSILKDTTAALADGDEIPQTSTNDKQIIGLYGSVHDATDDMPLTEEFSLSELRRLVQNPNSWRKIGVYAYCIVKPRIFHTRTSVIIDVCVLDEAAVTAAIIADEVPLFPDAEGAYVSALVAKLTKGGPPFVADSLAQRRAIA